VAYPSNGVFNPKFQWLDKKALAQVRPDLQWTSNEDGQDSEVAAFGASNGINWLAQKQHHTKDIGDSGIDEEVHGFASNDKSVLPQPWRRVKEAYPVNGVMNEKFQWLDKPAAFAQKDKNDIGKANIDENVHGFASEDKNVLPEAWSRSAEANPMPVNGS